MKSIKDSAIFKQLIKNAGVKETIKSVSLEKDTFDLNLIEEPLGIIKKRINFAAKGDVIQSLEKKKDTVLIFNPTLKLPKYFFMFSKMINGKLVTFVDLEHFAHINSSGDIIDIYPRTLFSLIQSSVTFNELFYNWKKATTHIKIVKDGSFIYSKLMAKILDKLFAININAEQSDLVHYLLAKFFIINMCDRLNNDTADSIAYYSCFNKTPLEIIKQEEANLGDGIYEDLFTFFDALSGIKGLYELNARVFVENWARMYGECTLLAMDSLPYFLAIIFSVATSGNIAKDYIIESVVGKNINSIYNEFFG